MGRAPCCDKANVKKGPWSPEEDAKLKAYIEQHGTGGNWIALPQKIGLKRCGKSCRLRWLNYLRPNIKHGGFSEEEDNIICSLYVSIGSRWSIIAAQLPGRTDNDIKNYWNTRLKKKLLGKQRNKERHQQHPQAQARRVNTLKQQQDQITKTEPNQNDHDHHHHLVSPSSGVLITNNQTVTPNYWPAVVEHCVAAAVPIMPVIVPNNPNNASTTVNIIQQDYDKSSSSPPSLSSSLLNELGGIRSFPHDHDYHQQQQPYSIVDTHDTSRDILSFPQDQQVYPATTMTVNSDDANIFLQGYENLFQSVDLSHLVSVNPQEIEEGSMQLQGFYGMESMEMASGTGSTNTTSTDQSTSYSWGDMSSLVINYSPNLVSHHYYEDNGCRQAGIPPQDASFEDSNRFYGIQLQ